MAESLHTIDVVVKATDRASNVLDRIINSFGIATKQGLMMGIGFKALDMTVNALSSTIMGSIDKYKEWETSIAKVYTVLENSEKLLFPLITVEIQNLSLALGESASKIADAYNLIVRSGFDVTSSLDILNASGRLAKAQGEDLVSTTNLVTLSMKQWGLTSLDVNNLVEKLNTVLDNTVYNVDALAGDFTILNPIAKELGMNIDELLASLITLNEQGVENISRGFVQLANSFLTPSTEMISKVNSLGIAFDPLILEVRGFVNVLNDLYTVTDGNIMKMSEIVGNVRSQAIVTALSSDAWQNYRDNLEKVSTSTGDLDSDFNVMMSIVENNMKKFGSVIEGIQRGIGAGITGVFSDFGAKTYEDMINTLKENIDKTDWDKILSEIDLSKQPAKRWKSAFSIAGYDIVGGYEVIPEAERIFKAASTQSETFRNTYSKLISEFTTKPIADYFDKQTLAISKQNYMYQASVIQLKTYKDEIGELYKQKELMPIIKDYTDALTYIPFALENADYESRIFDTTTRNLVKTIRDYNNEIKDITDETNNYNQVLASNNIETMQIQLSGMDRRGRLTREEKQRLKELEKSDLEYRINIAQNQYDINSIHQNGLDVSLEQLNETKMGYEVYLNDLKDTYNKDYSALNSLINQKQFLIDYYSDTFIPEQYSNLITLQENFEKELVDVTIKYDWTDVEKTRVDELVEYYRKKQSDIIKIREATNLEYLEQIGKIPTTIPTVTQTTGTKPYEYYYYLPGRQTGGYIPETRPYLLHKGETVISASQNKNISTPVQIKVDPITVYANITDNTDIQTLVRKIELAIQSGLVEGITTSYG